MRGRFFLTNFQEINAARIAKMMYLCRKIFPMRNNDNDQNKRSFRKTKPDGERGNSRPFAPKRGAKPRRRDDEPDIGCYEYVKP